MAKKSFCNKKRIGASVPNDSFVFNLGRLWQEVISGYWDEASYLYKLIKEITSSTIKKRYSKELKDLWLAINRKNFEGVDKALEGILKW